MKMLEEHGRIKKGWQVYSEKAEILDEKLSNLITSNKATEE